MGWFVRKLDSLLGAVFAAVGGGASSQLAAYVHQYMQRLGGHLDEALRAQQRLMNDPEVLAMGLDAAARIGRSGAERITELTAARDAIMDSDPLLRPIAFLRNMDPEIALKTWEAFQPALPLDSVSLTHAGVGLVLGLLVYELIKLPVTLLSGRRRPHRKFTS